MKPTPELTLNLDPPARARLVAALVALIAEERRRARELASLRSPR